MALINKTSPELMRRYVAAGDKIRIEANTIFNLTRQLELSDANKVILDSVTLEHINQTLNTRLFNIWTILDDFIYLIQAQTILYDLDKKRSSEKMTMK